MHRRLLGVPVNCVTMILTGQRRVTADTALRLAKYLRTPPQIWLDLQIASELRRMEIEVGRKIVERGIPDIQ